MSSHPSEPALPSRRRARMLAAMTSPVLALDDPRPGVRRLTLNRPEKRNALNNELRGAILAALRAADADPAVKVSILRGAGPCFSSGYDLSADNSTEPALLLRRRAWPVGAARGGGLVHDLGAR